MDVVLWVILGITTLFAAAALTYIYIECGKSAIECVNEFTMPKKWRVLVRTLVFIFNPLFWIILIIVGILTLFLHTLKDIIEFIPGMNRWLCSTYKEVKELITK